MEEAKLLTTVILPLSLSLIMLGMGLSLTIEDFKKIITYPKAMFIGLVNQLIFLPFVGLTIAYIFNLTPAFLVGFMLLAACPGGVTSNLITHLSRGNTALSISLTVISSGITIITIPLITQWSLYHFMGDNQTLELPIFQTMMQIFAITVLPVSIGMWIRAIKPELALRLDRFVRIGSGLIFIIILVGINVQSWLTITINFSKLGSASLYLNLVTMGIGYGMAVFFRLDFKQAITIAIESGIQNASLAFVVAFTLLKNNEIGIPAAIYALVMFITGGLLIGYFGLKKMDKLSDFPNGR